jgi:hypothetical protein
MRALRRGGLWLCLFAAACAAPMQPPPDFVVLKDPGEGFRAVTADDARLRVRDLAEPTAGGIAFWSEALRADLLQRGYELVASGAAKAAGGRVGQWHEFAANVQGERVGYLVAVWVVEPSWLFRGGALRVVEFAAKHDVFKARVDAVRAALGTVRD